jgi:hypothetical protein
MQRQPKEDIAASEEEYVIVHKIRGTPEVIAFLKETSHTLVERVCFEAKHKGSSIFTHAGNIYTIRKERDGSYIVCINDKEE